MYVDQNVIGMLAIVVGCISIMVYNEQFKFPRERREREEREEREREERERYDRKDRR